MANIGTVTIKEVKCVREKRISRTRPRTSPGYQKHQSPNPDVRARYQSNHYAGFSEGFWVHFDAGRDGTFEDWVVRLHAEKWETFC